MAAIYSSYSGTLPVMFINTGQKITSKTEYIAGTYYIDNMGMAEITATGDSLHQEPLLIRGRGNYTWTGFEKKSYKIKLTSSTPLLGLSENKHFALLAHADGGYAAFFRNTAGFELGRLLGMDFTPSHQPIELVLNGEYMGLYFLTETIRVDSQRVNITKQKDLETNPQLISGGWLVEIDNTMEKNQIHCSIVNTDLDYFLVTYHTPEELSDMQKTYLSSQMRAILNTIYMYDKYQRGWEQLIDIDVLVKFYLVHEILDNVEGFYGSCYMYKDLGETRWKFGPLWDLGHAFNSWHSKELFCYDVRTNWGKCIMEEIAKFQHFQQLLREVWQQYYPFIYSHLKSFLTDFAQHIAAAASHDYERWPRYGTADTQLAVNRCLESLERKRQFLVSQWGEGSTNAIVSLDDQAQPPAYQQNVFYYNLNGLQCRPNDKRPFNGLQRRPGDKPGNQHSPFSGFYIHNGRKYISK